MQSLIEERLGNGMKVLLLPMRGAPVVACNVWVGVGSADETEREAGLAHVHEHMLFKGTARRGVGEIAREVEAAGGHINAFTSFDQTCYYVVMSSRYLETGLDILSDAVRNSSFDAEELGRELEVIQEEIKRGEDSPSRVASLRLFETAYVAHPYRLPIIGTRESVDSFRQEDVLAFFKKHYVPANMTVVVAGDFELEEGRALVSRFFGDFEGGAYRAVERVVEPPQRGLRVSVAADAAQDVHLRIGFHVPDAVHEDIPAIELLGTILGQGDASRLYQKVQYEQELVHSIYAGSYTPRDAGLFMVSADYQLVEEGDEEPGPRSHAQVLEAVMREVFSACVRTPDEAEIARARTIIESQAIYSKQTVEGLAMKLGQYDMETGDARYEDSYYQQLSKVGAAELLVAASKYLTPESCTVVLSAPKGSEATLLSAGEVEAIVRGAYEATRREAQERDTREVTLLRATRELKAVAPAAQRADVAGARRQVVLDDQGFARVKLESGPTLIIQEQHAVELFSARALVMGGLRDETEEINGVSELISALVTQGTSKRDAQRLAHDMESIASSVSGMTGRNTFGWALTGLSAHFDESVELFGECMLEATLPEEEFERTRRLQLQEQRSRQDQLGAVTYDRFARAFFGAHPYGLSSVGTAQSVSGLTAERARAYLKGLLDPEQLVISVVGDVSAGECVERFEAMFAGRERVKRAGRGVLPAVPVREGIQLVTADLEKNQAFVMVGFDAPLVESEERYALEVLHAVLSGQGGRLFMELRDRQSLAYSVYASMALGVEASALMVQIGTSPQKVEQAIAGIGAEVRRLFEVPPTRAEVDGAKRYLIGNHDIGLQRNASRAMSVALDELYGLGYKRSFEYGDRIAAVSHEELRALCERYMRLETAVIAVTKPQEIVLEGERAASLLMRGL